MNNTRDHSNGTGKSGHKDTVTVIRDEAGNILHRVISPLRVEFHPKDVAEIMVGASLLAIPVAFTEETWRLGETLPLINILGISLLSLFFIGIFAYYKYYHGRVIHHWQEFFKRVLTTYILSMIIVGLMLTLIERAVWDTEALLAIKRIIIVAFPASMSASVADVIK